MDKNFRSPAVGRQEGPDIAAKNRLGKAIEAGTQRQRLAQSKVSGLSLVF